MARIHRHTAPFALIGIPFVGGMIAQSYRHDVMLIPVLLATMLAVGVYRRLRPQRSVRWLLVCVLMAALGSAVAYHDQQRDLPVGDQVFEVTGTIRSVIPTSRGCKAVVRV
ncbi:MAG: hypothetical protein R3330_04190, partial [Saprospiraceae bacterium]|nr:hypothetical protein [Saprospiraceae bacterium]